ncbi:MAG TPA: M56 family metallopeptidase [Mucilaginibacter sp.]|nr:M56 family metallopeptidase [Mucilaginibacter sp.]
MIPYVLHVALLISVCLLFYKIFLQRETFYRLNRIVLLICLCLSFALPLITIPEQWALRGAPEQTTISAEPRPVTEMYPQIAAQVQKQIQAAEKQTIKPLSQATTKPAAVKSREQAAPVVQDKPIWPVVFRWLFYLYWAGVAAFGLNLLLQVVVLLVRAYSNPVIRDGRFRIIEIKGDKAPCSFGNNIFINPEKYDWDTYNQILLHEKVHIQQGHSFDILLAELVLVFQWFNPFAWLYRGELENNLEFLTDEEVLGRNLEVEKESYQMSLLKVSAPHLALSVTTNYNQSLLKKRIVMMNAKRSNIHTMWKYFILVPLMAGLACALNQTAFSQSKAKASATHDRSSQHSWRDEDRTQGVWFATIKGDKVRMEFRSDDEDHGWSDNDSFLVSEFSALPKDTKADFTLKRDAGTMLLNGKFDGDEGYGHYKFTADQSFKNYLESEGIDNVDNNDEFAFFVINVRKAYVEMLKANGFTHLSKDNLISMAALKVDEPYIKFWKELGYNHLSTDQLVSGKALGITREYVQEIHNAGYTHLGFDQLISFKAQGIDGKYIASLKKANLNIADDGAKKAGNTDRTDVLPRAEDISSFKAMNIDSSYIRGLKNAGYKNIPMNELTGMKAVGVTPEYIKELSDIGYKNLSANELTSFKSIGVTPEYVKMMTNTGYANLSANEIESFKAQGITPEYVRSVADMGYKNLSPNELSSFKALGITAGFIKSFNDIGYKNIPPNDLTSLKALGIKPSFVKGFEAMGYKDISLNELSSLKALNITADYIKSFETVGYKQLSINDLSSLRALGVTPAFVQGFKDMGYAVSPNEATSLKASGITPQYVKEMKAKGFVSKDLNKYIQLNNAFN